MLVIYRERYKNLIFGIGLIIFLEKKFLRFFFNRIKPNLSDRYPYFKFYSLCGPELNYIRCDDVPVVFTHIDTVEDEERLFYGHAGDYLSVKFEPSNLMMLPETGRVYHSAMERTGHVGLVKSSLSIDLSKLFIFDKGEENQPTHILWKGERIKLKNHLLKYVKKFSYCTT